MNEATYVVGMDVAKRKLDIALLVNGKIKTKVVDNTPAGHALLQRWLVERGAPLSDTHICLEATGPYRETVATTLVAAGWPAGRSASSTPHASKGLPKANWRATKPIGPMAALLARFCAAMHPSVWVPPPPAWRELRAWVDRLQALKGMHQQESNRREAHQAAGQAALVQAVQTHLDWLAQQMADLERTITDHIDRHPDLKGDAALLRSIPGIGKTTVAQVLAYAGDVRRFANAKALAAFIGVTPRQRVSGSSVKGRTMMSRTGHAALRRALYMPGLVARRHNPVLRVFGDRLRATGLAPKAVVGAVMRKLAHLIYGVIKSGQVFDARLATPQLDFQDGI